MQALEGASTLPRPQLVAPPAQLLSQAPLQSTKTNSEGGVSAAFTPATMAVDLKTSDIHEEYCVHWDRTIGTGTNGPVFSCVHRKTSKLCALKCLPYSDVGLREAQLHQQLSAHPNIVPVMDIFDASVALPGEYIATRQVLLVTERMKGGELFDHVSRHRKFSEEDARAMLLQLAQAVAHCHRNNVAHRDIKPENFLLPAANDVRRICLTDFGYAKQDNGDLRTPVFTPFYVCPQILESLTVEQRKQHGSLPPHHHFVYDKSCDMWALGVILYILLCGYPPFRPNHAANTLPFAMRQKIRTGSVHFPKRHWAHISDDAKQLIRQLLHVDEARRLTAEQLLAHPWLAHVPSPSISPTATAAAADSGHHCPSHMGSAGDHNHSKKGTSSDSSCSGSNLLTPVHACCHSNTLQLRRQRRRRCSSEEQQVAKHTANDVGEKREQQPQRSDADAAPQNKRQQPEQLPRTLDKEDTKAEDDDDAEEEEREEREEAECEGATRRDQGNTNALIDTNYDQKKEGGEV